MYKPPKAKKSAAENSNMQLLKHQKGLVEAVCGCAGENLGCGVQI